jgi:hypothetical protein
VTKKDELMSFTRFSLKSEPLWILILTIAPLFQAASAAGRNKDFRETKAAGK